MRTAVARVFGPLQAGLDIEYSRASVGFTWQGFDELDEVSGDGSAELLDDDSIEIEFAYHGGVATNRSQSWWNTSVAAWKINPSLLR